MPFRSDCSTQSSARRLWNCSPSSYDAIAARIRPAPIRNANELLRPMGLLFLVRAVWHVCPFDPGLARGLSLRARVKLGRYTIYE
jgi:hypothetical protein